MSNYSKPGDTRYTVTVVNDGMMIYCWRYAGICGPAQSADRPATLAQVDEWLASQGFRRSGDYTMTDSCNGLWLEADLTEV